MPTSPSCFLTTLYACLTPSSSHYFFTSPQLAWYPLHLNPFHHYFHCFIPTSTHYFNTTHFSCLIPTSSNCFLTTPYHFVIPTSPHYILTNPYLCLISFSFYNFLITPHPCSIFSSFHNIPQPCLMDHSQHYWCTPITLLMPTRIQHTMLLKSCC